MTNKKTRKKMGHRQELTRVMVKSIKIEKKSPKVATKKKTSKEESSSKD